MSSINALADGIVHLNMNVKDIMDKVPMTGTILCPVKAATYSNSSPNTTVFVDETKFIKKDVTLSNNVFNVTGLSLGPREFIYNSNTGVFTMVNDPGLFSLGAVDWNTSASNLVFDANITRTNGSNKVVKLNGSACTNVILGYGDRFRLSFPWQENSNVLGGLPFALDSNVANFTMTRLSKTRFVHASSAPVPT